MSAQWHEVGRVQAVKEHGKVAREFQRFIRVAVGGPHVMIGLGTMNARLDAKGREEFSRLYFEACRLAEETP